MATNMGVTGLCCLRFRRLFLAANKAYLLTGVPLNNENNKKKQADVDDSCMQRLKIA